VNPTLKSFLMIALKNAVNAALLSLAVVYHDPTHYNYTHMAGLIDIARDIVGPAVAIREGMIWVPKILKWSTTNGTPGS
jgi:hypothetical protein